MTFVFDMDGTLFDLYGVDNWLPQLRAEDASPYLAAKPMINFSLLARYLNRIQRAGHKIMIVSWTSKESTPEYHSQVAWAKFKSLRRHLPSVHWDSIIFANYGTEKSTLVKDSKAFLFDDDEDVRANWQGGLAFEPVDIFRVLRCFT